MTTRDTKTAAREIRYLATVGAYRYLDAAYDALRVFPGVELPALDDDTGLVPCGCGRCLHGPGKDHRGHDVGTFKVYADAEATALSALESLTGRDVAPVLEAVKLGVDAGDRLRARLLTLDRESDRLIPGRGGWLTTPPTAEEGCSRASVDPSACDGPGRAA